MLPAQIAERWIEAFNRHDVAALVGLYAEDAVHHSPKLRAARPETLGRITGKAALTAWWHDAFVRLPGLRYKLQTVTADAERVFIVYERHVPGEAILLVAECFTVCDGLVVESSVFHG